MFLLVNLHIIISITFVSFAQSRSMNKRKREQKHTTKKLAALNGFSFSSSFH